MGEIWGTLQDDLMFNGREFSYGPRKEREMKETAWSPVVKPSHRQTITLQLPTAVKADETLILTVGVQMGAPDENGEVVPVARQGAGVILRVG